MSVTIMNSDVFDGLSQLEDESVHCVVTSPPYWGLRCYGIDGQIGMEPTLGEHIEMLVRVFEEVRRVLREDGTLWLNYGDCYNAYNGGAEPSSALSQTQSAQRPELASGFGLRNKALKPKDLCLMPHRLAIALQDAGWWVRSDIIWHKPNPMPESTKDRPTSAHEHIFLLTKAARYFYDADAVRQPFVQNEMANGFRGGSYTGGEPGPRTSRGNYKMPDGWGTGEGAHGSIHREGRGHGRRHAGFNDLWDAMSKEEQQASGANLRNVWTIATRAFPEAHFATFPPELPEKCIKAGCPVGGTVLDPFGGAGTTGLVADRLGRDAILIELNPDYCEMARKRIDGDAPLFTKVQTAGESRNDP